MLVRKANSLIAGLITVSLFVFGSFILSCSTSTAEKPDSDTSPEVPSDPDDNPVDDTPVDSSPLLFTQTGACGWEGSTSVSVSETSVDGTAAWHIVNNNWNAAAVFSVNLGEQTLSDFAGLGMKVRIDSDNLAYRNLAVEVKAPGATAFTAIEMNPPTNLVLARRSAGSAAVSDILELVIAFDYGSLGADSDYVRNLTNTLELAIGISAPADTSFTLYDLRLINVPSGAVHWTEAPALKEAAAPWFDYFGIAVLASELSQSGIRAGLARHADSITLGNEFKPDAILGANPPAQTVLYTGPDGVTYPVPGALNFSTVDQAFSHCRDSGLTMRGHVLVWHSQTPEWFFRQDFNTSLPRVGVAEMNARMRWYIESVLTHVQDWENENNAGERIITSWDVVNEAASDQATSTNWLRGADSSSWFAIYGNADFIVNAFVYANEFASSDVLLAYNDYNTYIPAKTAAILKIIDAIQADPEARIDVLGMQSHVLIGYPGVSSYRTAVEAFFEKGLDVQVTELDIHTTSNDAVVQAELASVYADYFTLFLEKRKTGSLPGITGITLWGITDANTWLTDLHDETSYPLLFDGLYYTKPAFDTVIEILTSGGI